MATGMMLAQHVHEWVLSWDVFADTATLNVTDVVSGQASV